MARGRLRSSVLVNNKESTRSRAYLRRHNQFSPAAPAWLAYLRRPGKNNTGGPRPAPGANLRLAFRHYAMDEWSARIKSTFSVGWAKAASNSVWGTVPAPPCPRGRIAYVLAAWARRNTQRAMSQDLGRLCPPYERPDNLPPLIDF